jgi:hypothetical protein
MGLPQSSYFSVRSGHWRRLRIQKGRRNSNDAAASNTRDKHVVNLRARVALRRRVRDNVTLGENMTEQRAAREDHEACDAQHRARSNKRNCPAASMLTRKG